MVLTAMVVVLMLNVVRAQRFTAYYTKINTHYPVTGMVQDELFGKYADLMVEVKDRGHIRFTRKTSYLPVWETDSGAYPFREVVERKGNGPAFRPDIISKYSHVRLIQNDDKKIVVHWRYFPDFNDVDWDGVVDEYFKIFPDGRVVRTVRKGTERYRSWADSSGMRRFTYLLHDKGIELVSRKTHDARGDPSLAKEARHGDEPPFRKKAPHEQASRFEPVEAPLYQTTGRDPVVEFAFDRGLSAYARKAEESVSGHRYEVKGPQAYWKKGVSGSALQFDGYYSGLSLDQHKPELSGSFSVDGWVALGAYPFGWAPVIQQSEWGKEGFYFGVNEQGYPGIHISLGYEWYSLVDSSRIGLFEWYHLGAVYSHKRHTLSLYRNGKKVASRQLPEERFTADESPYTLGLNRQKMPPIGERVRRGEWPSKFGVDGLLDEIHLYDKALASEAFRGRYNHLKAGARRIDMEERHFPRIPEKVPEDDFGAHYTQLDYYETWDHLWRVSDHADLVVSFDEMPVNVVSWRGITYGHYFVTEQGQWIGDQSNEDYRLIDHPGEAEGCLEHMSDKQCRHSHVRVVENTDARVVVHWRYGLVDSRYKMAPGVDGWGGWTDEYWTIYPDGVAVRHVPRGIVFGDGWVETMFLSEPGTRPEDHMNLQAYSLMNAQGQAEHLSWKDGSPEIEMEKPVVAMVNSKSDYRMFNVYPTGSSIRIFGGHSDRSHFHWWNHWPVSQITSDGRGAKAGDRMAHSSFSHGAMSENYFMYGITDKDLEELLPLAKSWNHAPELTNMVECTAGTYRQQERAYHLNAGAGNIKFDLKATPESPAVNPSFVISHWKGRDVTLKIDGERVSRGADFRYGFVDRPDGTNLVIWLDRSFRDTATFEISTQ